MCQKTASWGKFLAAWTTPCDRTGKAPSWASLSPRDCEGVAKTKQTTVRSAVMWCSVLSRVRLYGTPWTATRQASLSFTISGSYSNSCPLSW